MTESQNWRNWLMNLLGATPEDKKGLLRHLRELQKSGGYLGAGAMEMIEGVLSMSEWQIRNVMIPKNDIVGLPLSADYQTAVNLVCAKEHSRYPVFAEDGEKVCGILMAKDLLPYAGAPEKFRIAEVMRPPMFEPMSKNLDAMLESFRRHRTHMAIVADEYEEVVGIITIEDVLERIVGEIEDEFDDDEDKTHMKSGGGGIVNGPMSVEEFNAVFGAELPEDGADTVAGWLAAEIGRLPEEKYVHRAHGFAFEVLKADDRRIYTLKVTPENSADGGAD
ncbi:MAG: transporter associated domain-containing protein [Gammaproteobacteria bacterium]